MEALGMIGLVLMLIAAFAPKEEDCR